MSDSTFTVQIHDGASIVANIKGVPASAVQTVVRKHFADYMEGEDGLASWEDPSASHVRYFGVSCYGEVQDYPTARATEVFG